MKVVCVLQKTYGNLSSNLIKRGPSRKHYAFLVWWTLASHEKQGGMVPTRVSGHVFTERKASAAHFAAAALGSETEEQFGKRLKAASDYVNANYDVDGLCQVPHSKLSLC